MEGFEYRVIPVRQGGVRPSGSWLYVWMDIADGEVAYVGATGFDPELRAHLHVTSEDPDHGRVRASVPHYEKRDFDVLAFGLPAGVDRAEAKSALVEQLTAQGRRAREDAEAGTFAVVMRPIIDALENHRGLLQRPPR